MNKNQDGTVIAPVRINVLSLAELRCRMASIKCARSFDSGMTMPIGVKRIDDRLPGGGLSFGCLHEFIDKGFDAGTGFCTALLGKFAACRDGFVLWCLSLSSIHEFGGLYAPGLVAGGLDPQRLIVLRAAREKDVLWAMEEGLRCNCLVAVLGEVRRIDLKSSRRLQLAAKASGTSAFLLRHSMAEGDSYSAASTTRWRLTTAPVSASAKQLLPLRERWCVELLRCRGGLPGGEWILEWNYEAGDFHLVTDFCDRSIVSTEG